MLKFNFISILILTLLIAGCNNNSSQTNSKTPYELVNPFIGTGGHGHTYPGATLPFGMVQLSPDTRLEGWDGCSGYHHTDSIIYGFSHTHLSGTGVPDYGDILIMPTQGDIQFDNGYKTGVENGYASTFKKESEQASPGFYSVHLDEHDIDVKLTTTTRVGIHNYTFNQEGKSNIILDLEHRDEFSSTGIVVSNKKEVIGHRVSKAWAEKQHIYFVMQFSREMTDNSLDSSRNKAAFTFDIKKGEQIEVAVGISAVSIEGARKNLEQEYSNTAGFSEHYAEAKSTWEKALNKIEVQDQNEEKKTIFYSALYHSMLAPNTFSDIDGQYRGMDQEIHTSETPMYTVFSLWDTFRATHPLYTIIEQEKTNQFINTFLNQYQQGGELPIWELACNYTGCMIGYHAVPVIADAYIKGIRGYDTDLALESMMHSAQQDKLGLSAYKSKGFIAAGDEAESVSKTLEYAYDDWCISKMAKAMNKDSIYTTYIKRAQYYKNIFNPEVGFMQSKMNGGWSTGFDPSEVNFNFTEANSWQYSMFAPQDISGLINLYGGADNFEEKLDKLFTTEMELSGRHQVDITGLIGQYAHGNEPSHHMAYLYNYIGKPYKTQERIHQILTEQYTTKPDGLSGNEDCGQMSAWYVLSSMGFYSVTPGLNYYAIGTPHFEEVKINLENGNQFIIKAENLTDDNIYIQSATLNGKTYNASYFLHEDIMKGGELIFEISNKPNKEWGSKEMPISSIKGDNQITSVPYFNTPTQVFTDSLLVEIKSVDNDNVIMYSINNDAYKAYEKAIVLKENASIKTYAVKNNKKSFVVDGYYKKIKGGRSIELKSEYSNQYSAGGDNALIDILKGTANFRTGYWQGYYATDFEAVVDLGKVEPIHNISVGALQDIKYWIWYPESVTISTSNDGITFKKLTTIKNTFPLDSYGSFTQEFAYKTSSNLSARYVKIEADHFDKCPDWHLGAGNDTWLFLDEITID